MSSEPALPLVTHENGKFVLDLPFSDGKRVKLVLGSEMPDLNEWLKSADPRKAFCARMYFSAAAHAPISSEEFYSFARGLPPDAHEGCEGWGQV